MPEPTLTAIRAQQHETLVLQLEALLSEVRPLAARHPASPVPPPLAGLAEGLLFDARPFTPHRRREILPAAAPDFAGLVVQLGQVLALLDAFEVRHSFWSAEHAAYVWRIGHADRAPVARLRPRLSKAPDAERRASSEMRDKVVRLMEAKVAEAYERGLADGQSGTLPIA